MAVTGLRPGWDMFVLVCSVRCDSVSDPPTEWPHDHGPTNVAAMVKIDAERKKKNTQLPTP